MSINYLRVVSGTRIGGTIVPFTSRANDAFGNYWDSNTDFGLDRWRQRPVFYYHASRDTLNTRAGTVLDESIVIRSDGVYGEADIDPNDPAGNALLELVLKERAAWSSGAMPNHVRARQNDGYIYRWWWNEATGADIADTAAKRQVTKISHIRVYYPGATLPGSDDDYLIRSPFVMFPDPVTPASPAAPSEPAAPITPAAPVPTERAYTPEELRQMLSLFNMMAPTATPAPTAPAPESPGRRLPAPVLTPAPEVPNTRVSVGSKWDGIHPWTMTLLYTIRRQLVNRFDNVTEASNNRMFDETFFRSLLSKLEWAGDTDRWESLSNHQALSVNEGVRVNRVPHTRIWDDEAAATWQKYVPHLRVNEAMQSNLTNYGLELIPTLMNTIPYYVFELDTSVYALFESFQMPSNPFDYPTVTGGPTFRYLPEAVNQSNWSIPGSTIKTSAITTNKVQFRVWGSAGAMTLITQELLEESGVNLADVWARRYLSASGHAMDYVVLNADTEPGLGLNVSTEELITTSVWDIGRLTDGLRKKGLPNGVAIAAASKNHFLTLGKLLGTGVTAGLLGRDIKNLVAIIDPFVAYAFDAITDYETLDNVGAIASLLTGQVGAVKGVPLIVSQELPKSLATGYLDELRTGTKGSAVLAWRPGIKIGRLRDVRTRAFDVPGVEGMMVQSSFRICVGEMEPKSVTVGFNTTV